MKVSQILILIMMASFSLLLIKAYKLQVIEHDVHSSFIESLESRIKDIPPLRGKIKLDDGTILAWDEILYTADAWGMNIPEEIKKKLEKIVGRRKAMKLLLGEKILVSKGEAELLKSFGIKVSEKIVRRYKNLAPHVVGYIGSEREGISGVEKAYDEVLKGQKGSELVVIDPSGKELGKVVEVPPIPGKDVVLTLKKELQEFAEKVLKEVGKAGVIIVSNPKTGEIYTLASFPSFDPNTFTGEMFYRKWLRMKNDPKAPLLNRAISALYPPGSSIKPLYALAFLLNNGDPNEGIVCKGRFAYKNKEGKVVAIYKDWKISGHGFVDLRKALRVSCNVYFYQLGLKLGIEKMKKMASLLRLDDKTGIDLPGEVRGIFPSPSWKMEKYGEPWYPGDTILLSIGQGYILLTPMEMLNLISFIANRGKVFKPHVVKKVGKEYIKPKVILSVDIEKDVWDYLIRALKDVTSFPGNENEDPGTAYKAFKDFDHPVAGKTGTAETSQGKPHSWFIGFSPIENPEVAIVVLIEKGGYGSEMAAPIARRMLDLYFKLKSH